MNTKNSPMKMLFMVVAVATLVCVTRPAIAQRVQSSDLVYKGAFRLPDGSNGSDWTYSGYGMTYYPGGDPSGPTDGYPGSLFAIGNDQQQLVSEITIPVPVISPGKNLDDLNTATTLQPFHNITGGVFGALEVPRADIEYLPAQSSQTTGKIHFCWGQHFQFEQVPSHGWCDLDLANPQSAGAWYFGNYSNYVTNDYLFEIPEAWAAANTPGQRLATGRFRDGSWGGQGPALFAYGPWNDGNPPASNARLASLTPLLLYGVQEPGVVEITNDPSMKMSTYKEPDEWSGGAWLTVGANSAVVLVGTKALGRSWYGFSNGVEYPTSDEPGTVYPEVPPWPHDQRGWWSEEIEAQLIFYDPADLAAVAAGTMQPYEPQPYASLSLDTYLFDPGYDHERHKRYLVGDISFDRQRGYLYLIERMADEDKSIVHVFAVQGSSTSNSFRLYFPHIASNATWETEIAVINQSATETITGTLQPYGDSGIAVSTALPLSLPPHARNQITIGTGFANPTSIGYLIFEASSANVTGYTKFYQSGIYRVAIPAVKDINTADLYVTHIASNQDWWTGLSLLNTTSQPVQLTFDFDDGTSVPLSLAANQHYKNTIEQLLGGQSQTDIHSAVIRNGSGVIGLELFGNTASQAARRLEGILLADDTTTALYYPHVASDATWWTGIVAYNPAASGTALTVRPYSASGNSLSTASVPLDAGQKYLGTAELLGLPAETAWLRIDASFAITGFELVGTRDGNRLAGFSNLGSGFRQAVLPKLEKQGSTRIALVNIEDVAAAVTLAAYNDAGTLVATTQLPLASHQKVFDDAQDFFQQSISTATYLAYSADRNLVAYQLNNSTDNALLDGLPALGEETLPDAPLPLPNVDFWAYQIQGMDSSGALDALTASKYDLLVLEPFRTDWSAGPNTFDTKSMLTRIKASKAHDGLHRKLAVAYVNIGQAEDWRWYWTWSTTWQQGQPFPSDWPRFILAADPDGWLGNYPVAYWDSTWQDIIIYGQNTGTHASRDYMSALHEVINDGFDGIYLDWVEGFENDTVMSAAQAAGIDPAQAMIEFISRIRTYARQRNPSFLVIQQNAAALSDGHTELYSVIDGIAQEEIWYGGVATDDWNDSQGYDIAVSSDLTNEYLTYLSGYRQAGLAVFCCEYALNHATTAYSNAASNNIIAYCTRRSLNQLTTTPPPSYGL